MSAPIANYNRSGQMSGQTRTVYFASVCLTDIDDLVALEKRKDLELTTDYVIGQLWKREMGNRCHGFVSRDRNSGSLIGYHGIRRNGGQFEVWSVPRGANTADLREFVRLALTPLLSQPQNSPRLCLDRPAN